MKNIIRLITGALLATPVLISGCRKAANDFLDEPPSKSQGVVITTTAQLDALFDNHNSLGTENGATVRMYGTDDYDFTPAAVNGNFFHNSFFAVAIGTWERSRMENSPNSDWASQWSKVFTANLVLTQADKVSGPQADKDRLKAEARFVRAVAYWTLANVYCLPYTAENGNEPGLPLKTSTSFEEDLTRASLAKTYEFIEADLAEALKITDPIIKNGRFTSWRANIAGVNAFAARYYLMRGNYALAEQHATTSLNAYSELVNYNTEVGFSSALPLNFPSTVLEPADPVNWKEFTAFRLLSTQYAVPSEELKNLYSTDGTVPGRQNDLRYKYFVVEGSAVLYGLPAADMFVHFGLQSLMSGTTVGETIVTKAEAQARQNKVSDAMTTINVLRAKRMNATLPANVINLTAGSQAEAITKLLQERRRELPITMRWFDLRRLNNNETPADDVTIIRQMYQFNDAGIITSLPLVTYTLEPKSRKYAVMIPQPDIYASQNVIAQNTY